ncbi:hypothetical protein GDO81_020366 [Engystomops pustulosus]|uniref:Uncharacterized protein n=1 Tax=Engystomops pustulosus TaxID=76066 RepID=A0AAV6ZTL1_ENGPU|nr:hypothetical protein GDO81_020366 [Engystomops pustulosus]
MCEHKGHLPNVQVAGYIWRQENKMLVPVSDIKSNKICIRRRQTSILDLTPAQCTSQVGGYIRRQNIEKPKSPQTVPVLEMGEWFSRITREIHIPHLSFKTNAFIALVIHGAERLHLQILAITTNGN